MEIRLATVDDPCPQENLHPTDSEPRDEQIIAVIVRKNLWVTHCLSSEAHENLYGYMELKFGYVRLEPLHTSNKKGDVVMNNKLNDFNVLWEEEHRYIFVRYIKADIDSRGKGACRNLLERLRRFALSVGIKEMRVNVDWKSIEQKKIFKRLGFGAFGDCAVG